MPELMKCGHAANGHLILKDGTEKPCCVICDCTEVIEDKPDLTGRVAKCGYCGKIKFSSYNLPFFRYNEDLPTDSYYCGCMGWD